MLHYLKKEISEKKTGHNMNIKLNMKKCPVCLTATFRRTFQYKPVLGGTDIKGWVQRETEQMVFLWWTCQEQINPWFGGIIRIISMDISSS